jgi:hypothetical protein
MKEKAGLTREVTVDLGDQVVRLAALTAPDAGPTRVRVSALCKDTQQLCPLELSEAQLVTLLERAIRAGLLTTEFIHSLKAEFEI